MGKVLRKDSMMICALCENMTWSADSKLCWRCTHSRLAAASQARILSGTGLTYANAAEYSEENWIKAVLDERKEHGEQTNP